VYIAQILEVVFLGSAACLDSKPMFDVFWIGKRNRRGVTSRLPRDGGKLGRNEAAKYRGFATALAYEHPRTAKALDVLPTVTRRRQAATMRTPSGSIESPKLCRPSSRTITILGTFHDAVSPNSKRYPTLGAGPPALKGRWRSGPIAWSRRAFAVTALQLSPSISSKGALDPAVVALQANVPLSRINDLCVRASPGPPRTPASPLRPTALVPVRLDHS
jgi:hypothetical protein